VKRCGLDSSGSELEPVPSSYENGNEPCGSVTGGKFLEQLIYCWLLKGNSAPWS